MLNTSVDVRVKDTHLNLQPTCMDRYAAESRTERFWASFQLSLRTNLSIERKSGNESKHSDAITHIHTHKRARNRVRVSFGCWWNGKLIRSSVDLFKVYFRIGWCACVCVYVFILFVSGDSFSTRDSAIFSFAIVCVYSAVYNIEICMNVWPSSILFRWLCALSTCYGVYVLLLYNQIHTDTHTECTAILWDAKSSTCKTFKKVCSRSHSHSLCGAHIQSLKFSE